MKATTKSVDLSQVLRLVQLGRHALGMAPRSNLPKGLRGLDNCCPLARAFRKSVSSDDDIQHYMLTADYDEAVSLASALGAPSPLWATLTESGEGLYRVFLPQTLNQFVLEFDEGFFPEFVLAEQ
jgi:hypothetical protein